MIDTPQARLAVLLTGAAISITSVMRPNSACSGESSPQATASQISSKESPARDARRQLESVTIQARREKELKRQISRFVASVVVSYLNDSLARWDTPICPLVAGLPANRGEFILARASFRYGAGVTLASDAASQLAVIGQALPNQTPSFALPPCAGGGAELGTHLRYNAVQTLTSVIIVVDSTRTTDITIGQLADYVAMAGFAQIRLDANTGTAPTILSLFRSERPPLGLSPWDESFLHSVYTTDQTSVMQESAIKRGMFERIGR